MFNYNLWRKHLTRERIYKVNLSKISKLGGGGANLAVYVWKALKLTYKLL